MAQFKVYINDNHFQYLVDLVHQYTHERFVCLMGNVEYVKGAGNVIVIKEMNVLNDDDYDGLHTALCVPKKEVISDMLKKVAKKRYSVYIEYHTHPFNYPHFSDTDRRDEESMWNYFHDLFPNKYYGNMVLDINGRGEAVIRDWHNGRLAPFEPVAY